MNITIFDNGTAYLNELEIAFQKFGQITITNDYHELAKAKADLIVLSGGHQHPVLEHPSQYTDLLDFIRTTKTPLLGICLGAEIIAHAFDATLERMTHEEKGLKKIEYTKGHLLFANIVNLIVFENHHWAITKLSDSLEGLAKSKNGIEIIKHKERPIFGFQFHPEVFQDQDAKTPILVNLFEQIKS